MEASFWLDGASRPNPLTSADLFGLHTPPAKPHPSYSRLSRYDATGLCWLLQGRPVVVLTTDTAAIREPHREHHDVPQAQ